MSRALNTAREWQSSRLELLTRLDLKRRVIESVSNGITISDAAAADMPLIYVNPAFEKMTGYRSEEVLGRNCRFLQQGDGGQTEIVAIRRAIQQQRELRTVLKNYTKLGTIFWNELYLSPVFNSREQLTHYVGIQNDITERVELERQLEHLALHDGLTELANRGLMLNRLQEGLDRAKRFGNLTALLFFDLDKFKEINDVFGHQWGDHLLKVVATRLKLTARDSDCAARVGGDEFVLVAPDIHHEAEATKLLRRLRSAIELPVAICGQEIVPRVSIGLGLGPRDGASAEEILKVADVAMYADKHARFGPDRGER